MSYLSFLSFFPFLSFFSFRFLDDWLILTSLFLFLRRVDHQLNCVKGGGACHLREKVLAEAAKTYVFLSVPGSLGKLEPILKIIINSFVLVADYRKNVQYLGTNVGPIRFKAFSFPSPSPH